MRKRLFSLGLCLAFIVQLLIQAPAIVSAAGDLIIQAPLAGNKITGQYVVKYSVSNTIDAKNIVISYRDEFGAMATVKVQPNTSSESSSLYKTLIRGIGNGENTISVQVETATGELITEQRSVFVNTELTNVMKTATNVEPYTSDPNKFKNLLKKNNTEGAIENKKVPKDNAFISRFVDILFEEAAVENVRPDVVFAQMMLETGWLGYNYTVTESQNNFGGIGATGGGVRGNVFQSMRDGIRVNVQHLVAYSSTAKLKGTLIDPRFTYVDRGNAPQVEYLGYYENVNDGGWAMGAQYGYVILDIMRRVKEASAQVFLPTPAQPLITEFEVSSISKATALNVNLTTGFAVGKEIRLGVATNSDTEHRFIITNKTTGTTKTTVWSENKAEFFKPDKDGLYLFQAEVRTRGGDGPIATKSKEITIGKIPDPTPPSTTTPSTQPPITTPVDPDKEVEPVIGSVTLSSSPYLPGKEISISIEDASDATARVNEYQLEVEKEGVKSTVSAWSMSRIHKFTPDQPGDYLIRVLSRNKLVGGVGVKSIVTPIKVIASNAPIPLIAAASISDPTLYKNKPYQINVTPVPAPGITVQYQLVKKGTTGNSVLTGWTNNPVLPYTPDQIGAVTLQVQARNQAGDGTILDTRDLKLTILEPLIYSPDGFIPANPASLRLTGVHIAGLKSAGRNLIFSALGTATPGVLYRFYVINAETGLKTLVKDWSTSTSTNWRAVYGYHKLVVEIKQPNSKDYWDARMELDFRIKNYPTVFLDPGHGGQDTGYVVTKNKVTYRESELTLSMANLIRTKLQGRGINVINSRYSNETVSLDERVKKAVDYSADLFITLHYTTSSVASTKGVRTYYAGAKSDPLANLYLAEGKEAAEFVGKPMAYYYTKNRGINTDQSVLGYSLRLLKDTTMPSLQLNLGYLSNSEDLVRISSSSYRDRIAQKIADGIMAYLNNN